MVSGCVEVNALLRGVDGGGFQMSNQRWYGQWKCGACLGCWWENQQITAIGKTEVYLLPC